MTLQDLNVNESGKVVAILTEGLQRRRMLDMGLVPDTIVKAVRRSAFGDPTAYEIRGAVIALRKEEAQKIVIEKVKCVEVN